MLTPVVVGDNPPTTSADPTTRNIQWATPTQTAQPGSINTPDAPSVTSKATNGEPSAVDPRPKSTQAIDPTLLSGHSVDTAVDPAQTGGPILGGDHHGPSSTSAGDSHAPKQQPQAPPEAHPKDPQASTRLGAPQSTVEIETVQDLGTGHSQSNVAVNTDPIYPVGEHTLVPGGPAVTINNVPYSLAESASALVSGTKTIALAQATAKLPALEVDSQTYTANEASQYVVSGQTLHPGGSPVVVDHATYSLAPSAATLLSNDQTVTQAPDPQNPPMVTIGGKPISADTRPRLTIDGQGLIAGGPTVTINDVPFALAPSGTALIAGTSTIPIQIQEDSKMGTPLFQ